MDDQIPELDGTSEQVLELELEPTATEKTAQGGDPLDEISDPAVRSEAKKHRAIARRLEKKPEAEKPAVVTAPSTEFVTKADFQKTNERKAIKDAVSDPEVKANWSEIIPFYTPRRGKETPEDISEDIKDAITLWKARNPEVQTDTSAADLTTTAVVKTGGSGPAKTAPKAADPPNFKLPVQPKDWYQKKDK